MSDNEAEVAENCWGTIPFLLTFVIVAFAYHFFGRFEIPLINKLVTAAAIIKKNFVAYISKESLEKIGQLEKEKMALIESSKEILMQLQSEKEKVGALEITLKSEQKSRIGDFVRMNANFEKQKYLTKSEKEKVGDLQKTRVTLESQVDALKSTLKTEQNNRMELGRENKKLGAHLTLSNDNISNLKNAKALAEEKLKKNELKFVQMNANFEKQQAFTNSEEEKVGVLQKIRATLENQVDALKMTLNTEQNSRMKLGRENKKLEADLTLCHKNIDQMKASFQVAFKAEENQSNEKHIEQQALIKKLYGKVEKREVDLKNEQKSRALLQTAHDDLARKLEELSEQSEEAASNTHG